MNKEDLEFVKAQIGYDPKTGLLYWKTRGIKGRRKTPGGIDNKGYLKIRLGYLGRFFAHNIVWLLHNDAWPIMFLDHKDRDPLNNRIENLRLATPAQNAQNVGLNITNKSGIKGVHYEKGRKVWRAMIRINKIKKSLGQFKTKEEAATARQIAEVTFFGEFA